MQSLHWSYFKHKMGLQTLHLGLFDGQQLIGGAIFYIAADNRGSGIMVAADGPILNWQDETLAYHCLQLLLAEASSQASAYGVSAMRIGPRTIATSALKDFRSAPIHLNEAKTLHMDLTREPVQMLAEMKPKGRYNIRLAERNGVRIYEESSTSAVFKFYSIMQQVSMRDHFAVEPLAFFINLFETLLPAQMAKVLFAEHEGDVLGAIFMLTFGNCATYLYGGTTNLKRNLMGGYALQWQAINKARECGLQVYDFWGFDPDMQPDSNYFGFSRFKSQFGGQPVQYVGSKDYYFMDQLTDVVIKALNELSFDPTTNATMANVAATNTGA